MLIFSLQNLYVQRTIQHIVLVEADETGVCNLDAALREHPLLVGNIDGILLECLHLPLLLIIAARTLHLIDSPAILSLAQDIYSTVIPFKAE